MWVRVHDVNLRVLSHRSARDGLLYEVKQLLAEMDFLKKLLLQSFFEKLF